MTGSLRRHGVAALVAAAGLGSVTLASAGASSVAPPANDDFANAALLTGYEASGSSTTVGATGEVGEPSGSGPLNTVWWRWQAPADGKVTLDTYGSGLSDAVLCAYIGTGLTSLTAYGCDDDSGPGLSSALRVPVSKGQSYYIRVDGYGSRVGPVVVRARYPRCNLLNATVDLSVDGEYATDASDVVVGTPGNDIVEGGGGNDTICGFEGDDSLGGGPGNDVIIPGRGNDSINGGAGSDTVSFLDVRTATPLTVDLAVPYTTAQATGAGTKSIGWFENLVGGAGNDRLSGAAGPNAIAGGPGNDTILGRGGNDRLDGAGGTDICNGGPGTDTAANCEVRQQIP